MSAQERRRHVRTAADPTYFVGCTSLEGAGTAAADLNLALRLVDAGAKGACFLTKTRLRAGVRVRMLVVRPGMGVRAEVDATVRWSASLEKEGRVAHVTGVEFDRTVPALDRGITPSRGTPRAAQKTDPQRLHRRFSPREAQVVCVAQDGFLRRLGVRKNLASKLKDLSLSGAQIVSERSLKPGQQVDVEITLDGGRTTIVTEAIVRWCRRDTLSLERRWNAGVLFRTLARDTRRELTSIQLVSAR